MKILSSNAHGIIDYNFVQFLAVSPSLFKMGSPLCTITYSLACVHFLLTVLTDFAPGILKLIPFRIHGFIELIVAIGLGSLSLWFREQGNGLGFYYFAGVAVAILIVFNLTDFKGARKNI